MKDMDMSEMMSKMMNNRDNQKMPTIEMMQGMCKMEGSKNIKQQEMCMKMGKSLDELIKINQEILKEMKKS